MYVYVYIRIAPTPCCAEKPQICRHEGCRGKRFQVNAVSASVATLSRPRTTSAPYKWLTRRSLWLTRRSIGKAIMSAMPTDLGPKDDDDAYLTKVSPTGYFAKAKRVRLWTSTIPRMCVRKCFYIAIPQTIFSLRYAKTHH